MEKPTQGRPTKYTEELAKEIASKLSHMTAKQVCESIGIHKDTYYQWMAKYKFFSDLCIEARKTYAINLMDQAAEVTQEAMAKKDNPGFKDCVPAHKFICDNLSRLAGKANQGLYGDKTEDKGNTTINIIDKGKDFEVKEDDDK